MNPTVSVLLPTVRPLQWRRSAESVAAAAGALSYEIIVVADFMDAEYLKHTMWFERKRAGVVAAVGMAMSIALGEYVFLMNDESTLEPGALELLYAASRAEPWQLLAPQHDPSYQFVYYGLPFAPFPFARQDVVRVLGGLLDPVYKSFYADPDLSLRAHALGVPVKTVDGAVIHHHNGQDEAKLQNVSQYMAADRTTFRTRWDHLGAFCDC